MGTGLERIEHINGVVTYRSPSLAGLRLAHGFTTRLGGVAEGPFASLDLNTAEGESEMVRENYHRATAAMQFGDRLRACLKQVHGGRVVVVDHRPGPDWIDEADALVTDRPDVLLVIRTADCVPLLIASPDGGVVAAVHAGWRGVVAGVVPNTLAVLADRFGVDAAEARVAIGPAISVDHFEVGPEVAEHFEAAGLGEAVQSEGRPKPHVDLVAALMRQLANAGVDTASVDRTDRCTYRDHEEFFSYRRDGSASGRMAAMIGVRV